MNALRPISYLLLAALVLCSSIGFFVNHMVCGMSGEHRLAINTTINECSDSCTETQGEQPDVSCCDFDALYFKEDIPSTIDQRRISVIGVLMLLHAPQWQWALADAAGGKRPSVPWEMLSRQRVRRHVLLRIFLI